jgi:hypothetical protein
MTDQSLAAALGAVSDLEDASKAYLGDNPEPGECAAAMVVVRQAASLRGPLEKWIATRAVLAEKRRQTT